MYLTLPGVKVFFYNAELIRREIGPHGEIEMSEIDEEARWCAGRRASRI